MTCFEGDGRGAGRSSEPTTTACLVELAAPSLQKLSDIHIAEPTYTGGENDSEIDFEFGTARVEEIASKTASIFNAQKFAISSKHVGRRGIFALFAGVGAGPRPVFRRGQNPEPGRWGGTHGAAQWGHGRWLLAALIK